MNRKKLSHRRGFTLIEMLVVLVVILILAAILFPVFSRAREAARRASCQSNLKQIGMGMLEYAQDYDEDLVPYANNLPAPQYNCVWQDMIYPYVKNEQIFDCPSQTFGTGAYATRAYQFNMHRVPPPSGNPPSAAYLAYGSYVINYAYFDDLNASTPHIPPVSSNTSPPLNRVLKLSEIVKPDETIWVTDGDNFVSNDFYGPRAVFTGTYPPSIATYNSVPYIYSADGVETVARHLGTTNVLYCDGHVKAQRLENLLAKNSKGIYYLWTIEDD